MIKILTEDLQKEMIENEKEIKCKNHGKRPNTPQK